MSCPNTTETVDCIPTATYDSQDSLRAFVLLSYDTVFKPTLLYHVLLRRGQYVCGVAEVRAPAKKGGQKQKPANNARRFGEWGWKGAIWIGLWTVFNKLRSALPTPSIIRSTSTIKRVCKLFGVAYVLVNDGNRHEFLNHLKANRPDILLSFQHQIFRDRLLNLQKLACINCHPAQLPDYRGIQPLFWALAEGQATFGVTVHTMTRQIESSIRRKWTLADHYRATYALAVDAIIEAIDEVNNPKAITIPIDSSAKYFKRPKSGDIQRLQQSDRMAI